MKTNNKIWAIIPAAGSGKRFSSQQLKQYQKLDTQTVLEHSIQALSQLDLAGIVLVVAQNDDFIEKLPVVNLKNIHLCTGGSERVDSVLNGLRFLKEKELAQDDDWILVHDAARPCVRLENLQALVDCSIHTGKSSILAVPVKDTLKKASASQTIEMTVNRDAMWQAQTPQMSKLGTLQYAIEKALAGKANITDEASALEYAGHTVNLVQGRADNIKITYPDDLALAKLILQSFN